MIESRRQSWLSKVDLSESASSEQGQTASR